jgi:ATP-dependent DNA ligase
VVRRSGSIRRLPWRECWRELEALLGAQLGLLRMTPVLEPDLRLHHGLVADGWEGTVAKRLTSRYRCGRRSDDWVKLKSPDSL